MTAYASREASEITGVSLRQIQWWDERGYVRPQLIRGQGGHGRVRLYGPKQIAQLRLFAELKKRRRISSETACRALSFVAERWARVEPDSLLVVCGGCFRLVSPASLVRYLARC